ncbi:MAG: hypothetical protein LBL79_12980 [Prevotella sp.]|nr:hypothetical protein [Prevotella sp.]
MLLLIVFGFSQAGFSQITIGSGEPPHSDALLDLKENNAGTATKGLLLPRVALTDAGLPAPMAVHVAGMTVYNTGTSPTDGSVDIKDYVSPGFYYNSGSRWERLHLGSANWFYMPSMAIDVTTSGTFTRDLHLEYRKQFEDGVDASIPAESPTAGTPLIKSPDAPNPFTKIYGATELYYYVTGYDDTVFSNLSITSDGKLTYTIDADNVTGATYMNIVFIEKK